jgi:Type VI secretion system/phage-baseplate injector OB domain
MALLGVYRGQVVDASDLNTSGRVKVRVPQAAGGTSTAPVCYSCNCAWSIRTGATVIVAFEGGNTNYPVVLGQID